jgi:hypothetical protein
LANVEVSKMSLLDEVNSAVSGIALMTVALFGAVPGFLPMIALVALAGAILLVPMLVLGAVGAVVVLAVRLVSRAVSLVFVRPRRQFGRASGPSGVFSAQRSRAKRAPIRLRGV